MKDLVSIIVPVLRLERGIAERAAHLFRPVRGLRELVRDLERHVTMPYELIVVCNNPRDEALVQFLRVHHRPDPTAAGGIRKFCVNSVNVGVPRAWNQGAMLAEGEYLCFSNDDVEVGPNGLEPLIEVLRARPDAGQAGPQGGLWDAAGSGPRTGLEQVEEAEEISGFFFVLKRSVFEEVGGFDVHYTPAWFEEIDMSFRVRSRGYRCLVVPQSNVRHHAHYGVSSNDAPIEFFHRSIRTEELFARNRDYFNRRWRAMLRPPADTASAMPTARARAKRGWE
jgi:GT2 family glycosyltransferase